MSVCEIANMSSDHVEVKSGALWTVRSASAKPVEASGPCGVNSGTGSAAPSAIRNDRERKKPQLTIKSWGSAFSSAKPGLVRSAVWWTIQGLNL